MSRFLLLASTVCLLLGSAELVRAQDNSLAVIDKAIKAHGGEEQLAKLKARQVKIKGVAGDSIPFTQIVFYQAPAQIKEITYVDVLGRKSTIISVWNGTEGWIIVDGEAQELSDKKLIELKEAAHLARVSRLAGLKNKDYQLAALAEIQVGDRPAAGVKISAKGYRDLNLYFDKETGLLVKSERKTLDIVSDDLVNEETYYSGWKEIDGLKTPMSVLVQRDGKKLLESEAFEVKFLDRLDESIFAKP